MLSRGGTITTTALALAASLSACGGGGRAAPEVAPPAKARSAPAPAPETIEREPVRVALDARRVGASLRLDIEGVARGVARGEPFEDPQRWQIQVRAGEQDLRRLVNGPVEIDRQPVGGVKVDRWDTVIRFSVVYGVPEQGDEVQVRVEAPDPRSRPLDRSLRI